MKPWRWHSGRGFEPTQYELTSQDESQPAPAIEEEPGSGEVRTLAIGGYTFKYLDGDDPIPLEGGIYVKLKRYVDDYRRKLSDGYFRRGVDRRNGNLLPSATVTREKGDEVTEETRKVLGGVHDLGIMTDRKITRSLHQVVESHKMAPDGETFASGNIADTSGGTRVVDWLGPGGVKTSRDSQDDRVITYYNYRSDGELELSRTATAETFFWKTIDGVDYGVFDVVDVNGDKYKERRRKLGPYFTNMASTIERQSPDGQWVTVRE